MGSPYQVVIGFLLALREWVWSDFYFGSFVIGFDFDILERGIGCLMFNQQCIKILLLLIYTINILRIYYSICIDIY